MIVYWRNRVQTGLGFYITFQKREWRNLKQEVLAMKAGRSVTHFKPL